MTYTYPGIRCDGSWPGISFHGINWAGINWAAIRWAGINWAGSLWIVVYDSFSHPPQTTTQPVVTAHN